MQTIEGAILLPDRLIRHGIISFEGGTITGIKELERESSESQQYILPGLIDIHNHGAVCHDYMEAADEAFDKILDHLTSHGITSTLCTTLSAPQAQLEKFIDFYRYRLKNPSGQKLRCRLCGIHIEGPYISPSNRGAHPLDTLMTPSDGYGWILDNADVIREVTVAPELPGMAKMIRDLTKSGIVVSGGHDRSEPEDDEAAAESGMTHCTHIYCAMSTLHKVNGQRRCGLTEYAMTHDNITAEMIADNHHIPPMLAKMIYKAKGPRLSCVVSDAISPSGMPEGDEIYTLGAGPDCTKVIVRDGVALVSDMSCYAGSVQSLDIMIRNLVQDAGIPLADAVRMASLTPAEVIGIDGECGSLEPGKRADMCIMDRSLKVIRTIIGGETAFDCRTAKSADPGRRSRLLP